jgi:hypothetical protein
MHRASFHGASSKRTSENHGAGASLDPSLFLFAPTFDAHDVCVERARLQAALGAGARAEFSTDSRPPHHCLLKERDCRLASRSFQAKFVAFTLTDGYAKVTASAYTRTGRRTGMQHPRVER